MTNNTDPAGLSLSLRIVSVEFVTRLAFDDNPDDWAALYAAPHPPTREQIAEAISQAVGGYNQNTRTIQHAADAVLALIQNGADR